MQCEFSMAAIEGSESEENVRPSAGRCNGGNPNALREITISATASTAKVKSDFASGVEFKSITSYSGSRTAVRPLTAMSKNRSNAGYQIGRRKELFEKRKLISDFALVFGIFGIIVMVIESELASYGFYTKLSFYSSTLKTLISVSTVVLLGLIVTYHVFAVQIFLIQNCVDDWRIAMTWKRIIQITLELLFFAVHPIPGELNFFWTTNHIIGDVTESKLVPVDVVLSLPMFLRCYLIGRVMLLHRHNLEIDRCLQSDFFDKRFILKTLMTIRPGTVLLVVMGSLWIIISWTMRQCERYHNEEHDNLLNTMWMIVITFLTIGYGDMFPRTYCGRGIAVATGFLGAGCTALLVAVLTNKLELTQAEKHVHNLMRDTQLNKELVCGPIYYSAMNIQSRQLKNAAANVLRETWLIYKYKKLVDCVNPGRVRTHQRKFLLAIYSLRKAKLDRRKLMDNTGVDMAKNNISTEIILEMNARQKIMFERLGMLEKKLSVLQETVEALPETAFRHQTNFFNS
ncbi:hypothetical protein DAPPUDRAFT_258886 [Daphnia pulex]|uniref:Calmodulin-binding domain-containing protein n=1 Tax=Daphnia pulex TaxID=6669 RepID=E9HG77_DAPPU|nr:hypothetical protein DAPPUDRAFT_258886 [Daphnia pulex]|eukprot:EFX69273.1 hypothetical protein DAPPUDRAFT_258886 [Daphnia pulex]